MYLKNKKNNCETRKEEKIKKLRLDISGAIKNGI